MLLRIYKLIFCSIHLPRNLLFCLLFLLALLNILDAISTWKVVKLGNNKNERNPLARLLFNLLGPLPAMIILKGVAIIVISYIAFNYRKFRPDLDTFVIILNTLYLWIVLHNYRVLKRMKNILHSNSA
jgi:hypothetical protein